MGGKKKSNLRHHWSDRQYAEKRSHVVFQLRVEIKGKEKDGYTLGQRRAEKRREGVIILFNLDERGEPSAGSERKKRGGRNLRAMM